MLTDNLVTRLPNGITNVAENKIFNSLKQMDPTLYHQYFEDFDYYTAGNWTVTETDAGATEALANGDGGLLLLTNTAADDDLVQILKLGQSFTVDAGKKLFGRFRLKVSDATQSDLAVGLQVTNADGTGAVTDGIYFLKADGATTVVFRVRKNTTTGAVEAAVTGGNMASDTFIVFEFFYDGGDRVYYGYNGTIVGYVDGSSTFAPDTSLSPMVCLKNGEAVAKTCTIDYLFVAKER